MKTKKTPSPDEMNFSFLLTPIRRLVFILHIQASKVGRHPQVFSTVKVSQQQQKKAD